MRLFEEDFEELSQSVVKRIYSLSQGIRRKWSASSVSKDGFASTNKTLIRGVHGPKSSMYATSKTRSHFLGLRTSHSCVFSDGEEI